MNDVEASAAGLVAATPVSCIELLANVERYPDWCPEVVRSAKLVESGRARVRLRLGVGPLAGEFEELMEVRLDPAGSVSLTRVPHEPTDPERLSVIWLIAPEPPTRLELELAATLDVPRVVPLGAVARSVAQDLLAAATRALLPGSSIASASSS